MNSPTPAIARRTQRSAPRATMTAETATHSNEYIGRFV